ncbi:respiratory-chain NADH dehydrogenase, subunit 1 [Anaeromyxobacter sp. K]|uniref:Respiratory-chain NADH dehydrogenase, subunit 1 n=2 Tax=Anaeromyxobacter TaxID=161492 RepID=B8J7E1_ANAD2|nr:NADH-quinone oxidoreductase subunit H [Anaeromyxobacter dehalogenans]ACG74925.1 respiratory-chain NADH dehydrogenase, subunit 1 [Anaeromyxobacter sp. K]ACL67121.1 respiratory-chain NADH dehydrogenase, subunit 1 [Anaeromyxobacter dehalogenans 2CP-1]
MVLRTALHVVALLVLPPLLLGVINRVKSIVGGRRGPPLLQPYLDLAKLLRKGAVYSRTTTWVFRAGPVIGLAAVASAGLLLSMGGAPAPIAFTGDFVLFAYLLGLGRFFTALAALDTGSSFEGMGAAREVTFASLAEPALFLCLLVLARATGSLSLSGMLGPDLDAAWSSAAPGLLLAAIGLFVVALAECSRIPVDDPNTHLELTMIHEVMVLDHGGPDLALILYGAAMKMFLFGALLSRLVLGHGAGALASEALFFLGVIAFAVAVGVVESVMARLRIVRVPQLLVGASVLSAFALVLLLR